MTEAMANSSVRRTSTRVDESRRALDRTGRNTERYRIARHGRATAAVHRVPADVLHEGIDIRCGLRAEVHLVSMLVHVERQHGRGAGQQTGVIGPRWLMSRLSRDDHARTAQPDPPAIASASAINGHAVEDRHLPDRADAEPVVFESRVEVGSRGARARVRVAAVAGTEDDDRAGLGDIQRALEPGVVVGRAREVTPCAGQSRAAGQAGAEGEGRVWDCSVFGWLRMLVVTMRAPLAATPRQTLATGALSIVCAAVCVTCEMP